jgi:hypothetical protein
MTRGLVLALVLLAAVSCSVPAPAGPPQPTAPVYTNRVWRIVSPTGRAPGSFYIFLTDGTLVMTSCVETYRLATWRDMAPGRITIVEDPVTTYDAEILRADNARLDLRLHLKQDVLDLRLERAATPFVCPDLRTTR